MRDTCVQIQLVQEVEIVLPEATDRFVKVLDFSYLWKPFYLQSVRTPQGDIGGYLSMCVRVCACLRGPVCVRACVCVCVCVSVCVRGYISECTALYPTNVMVKGQIISAMPPSFRYICTFFSFFIFIFFLQFRYWFIRRCRRRGDKEDMSS